MSFDENYIEKSLNVVTQICDTKSIQKIIKFLVKETNLNKLNYDQLRYIFKTVRERCDVEVPKQRQSLVELPTKEEIARFFSVINNPIHSLIFKTLIGTGLRINELVCLEVKRIDMVEQKAFIFQGKGSKDRVVLVGNELKEKLQIYLASNPNNRYLFESNRHQKYSTRRIQVLCRTYKEVARIEKELTPHTFRHIFMTNLALAGVSEEKRAVLAGHSSSNMQKVYTHLTLGGIKDEVLPLLDSF